MADVLLAATIETPVGPLAAAASDDGLCMLEFQGGGRVPPGLRRLARWYPGATLREAPSPHLDRTREWLAAYFAGQFGDLPPVALDVRGTGFESAVWQAMREVPPGAVATYAALAVRIGRPGAARAVGRASGRNPVCLLTPCHRIVGSNGSLVGYGGGLPIKRWLLNHEAGARVPRQGALALGAAGLGDLREPPRTP